MAGFAIGLWLSSLLLGSTLGGFAAAPGSRQRRRHEPMLNSLIGEQLQKFAPSASAFISCRNDHCFVGVVTRESLLFSETMSHSLGRRLEAAILLAMALELLFFRWWGRRKKRELEEQRNRLMQ